MVFYTTIIHVTAMVAYNIGSKLLKPFWDIEVKIQQGKHGLAFDIAGEQFSYFGLVDHFPHIVVVYGLLALGLCYGLARLAIGLSKRWMPLGRMMYGPLCHLISDRYSELLTCYVLTKISDCTNRRLMYQGYPVEVVLDGSGGIEHLVLEDPDKFYMCFDDNQNAPETTGDNSKNVSSEYTQGLLYIAASEIENVHFERWLFK